MGCSSTKPQANNKATNNTPVVNTVQPPKPKTEDEIVADQIKSYEAIKEELKTINVPKDNFGDLYRYAEINFATMHELMNERKELHAKGEKGGEQDLELDSQFQTLKAQAEKDIKDLEHDLETAKKQGGADVPIKEKLLSSFKGRFAIIKKEEKDFYAKIYNDMKGQINI